MQKTFSRAVWPTEAHVAALLGLTMDEYGQLSHSGIRALTGPDGATEQFILTVSPLNPDWLLGKLGQKMDQKRTIHFPPDIVAQA